MADDSRRQMLVLLKGVEKTPSEISADFDFTFSAVSTHLKVLKEAGLVTERKEGKNRYYSLNIGAMSEMVHFLDGFWDEKLGKLKEHVEGKGRTKKAGD